VNHKYLRKEWSVVITALSKTMTYIVSIDKNKYTGTSTYQPIIFLHKCATSGQLFDRGDLQIHPFYFFSNVPSTEEKRVEEKDSRRSLFALSAGACKTTFLVMITLSPPLLLCPRKIFRHGNKKICTQYHRVSTQNSDMAWHW
jgi:hypothetical protein